MPPTRPANLLFVFADQMRAFSQAYMKHYGELVDPVMTPRLDRFATESTVLRQAVSSAPVCSPYRAMLFSGRYPEQSGVLSNITSARNYELRDSERCLTDVLADAGYDIAYFGKWHLTLPHEPFLPKEINRQSVNGCWNEFTPAERRHGITTWHAYNAFNDHMNPVYWTTHATRDAFIRAGVWAPIYEADQAIQFMEARAAAADAGAKPFAVFVSNNPPHPPFHGVPDRYLDLYRDATPAELLVRPNVPRDEAGTVLAERAVAGVQGHFAMISGVDEQFGRMLDALDRLGLADNTLVVFTSDHGEMMGSHRLMDKNVWYEESVRVPMMLRLPGQLAAGAVDDLLLGTADLPPMLLGLLGLQGRIPATWSGTNLAPTLFDATAPRPESQIYMNYAGPFLGVRTPGHTLVLHRPDRPAVRHIPDAAPGHLFDNREDPYQCHDLFHDKPALVSELTGLVEDWERVIRA